MLLLVATTAAAEPIKIGSKTFTESHILSELMAQLLESKGLSVRRFFGLGGTMVCYRALTGAEIDLYADYTGTIEQEMLKSKVRLTEQQIAQQVREKMGLELFGSFGFNNSYAIALTKSKAAKLGLEKISDMAGRKLRGGVSYEFLERNDGWPTLAEVYGIDLNPKALEHGLAYSALQHDEIDFTDAYTTDPKIETMGLVLLEDDQQVFPTYLAAPLVRQEIAEQLRPILAPLSGSIDEATIRKLNARVELEKRTVAEVARAYLLTKGLLSADSAATVPLDEEGLAQRVGRRTLVHIGLTFAALILAVLFAVPLGIASYRMPRLGAVIMPVTALAQTVPSIALLALMIPVFGIGKPPTVVALFIYALLPIVRNTYAGLESVDPQYRLTALAMGLTDWQRMRLVELPLSFPVILAGIKTAAVINIGTATLAAFIGAGGLGEPIVAGLARRDLGLILEGSLSAMALAVATEFAFRQLDRQRWRKTELQRSEG